MTRLEQLRQTLDAIDAEICRLGHQRGDIARQLHALQREHMAAVTTISPNTHWVWKATA